MPTTELLMYLAAAANNYRRAEIAQAKGEGWATQVIVLQARTQLDEALGMVQTFTVQGGTPHDERAEVGHAPAS